MDRRRASRFYYFDEAYYAALVAELPRGDCDCATLHLGGGLRPGDALATFKRAVGDVVLDWTLGTSVLDPRAFDALMAIRAAAVHTDVADLAARAGAFFPAYRAGLDGDDLAPPTGVS